eukprot:1202866-Pleurochrysis_carterae.AAC.1
MSGGGRTLDFGTAPEGDAQPERTGGKRTAAQAELDTPGRATGAAAETPLQGLRPMGAEAEGARD